MPKIEVSEQEIVNALEQPIAGSASPASLSTEYKVSCKRNDPRTDD